MAEQIKIVMADDHPIVRQGLKQIIEADPKLVIVAEAGDGETALALVETHLPDVAVLDIDMPKMNGFEVVKELRKRRNNVAVVFLTMHGEEEIFHAALDLDVKGYVVKDSALNEIADGIKAVAAGRAFFSPSLSALLLNRRRRTADFERENHGIEQLTPTERRILKLIADEKTSKQIGEQLYISYRTVEKHRNNISRKFDFMAHSRSSNSPSPTKQNYRILRNLPTNKHEKERTF